MTRAAVQSEIAGGAQHHLHELNVKVAQGDASALDGFAACVLPFLHAIE